MSNFNHIPKAQWHRDRIYKEGGFRCDRCRTVWPMSHLIWQDGMKLCRERCAYKMGALDSVLDVAHAKADGAENTIDPLPYPLDKRLDSRTAGVTAISPATIDLTIGGASVAVTLTTVGADSSLDTLSYTSGDISDATSPVWAADGTSITLDIQADGGGTAGDFKIVFNSDTLQFATIRVR